MMSWGWWGPGVFFGLICMVAMAWMMMMMMGHGHGAHGSHSGESLGQQPGSAKHILAERLARGEIDIDDYERRLATLQEDGEVDSAEEEHHGY